MKNEMANQSAACQHDKNLSKQLDKSTAVKSELADGLEEGEILEEVYGGEVGDWQISDDKLRAHLVYASTGLWIGGSCAGLFLSALTNNPAFLFGCVYLTRRQLNQLFLYYFDNKVPRNGKTLNKYQRIKKRL